MPVDAENLPDPATETPAPRAELVLAACFDMGPGYGVRRTLGARNWLVTWTIAGAGRVRQGDAQALARPGDLVVLGPDISHTYGIAPGAERWAFWWVHCPFRPSWHALLQPYDLGERLFAVPAVPEAVHDRIGSAFRRIHGDARWSGHGSPPRLDADLRTAGPAVALAPAARTLALSGVEEILLIATTAAGIGRLIDEASDQVDARVRQIEALLRADPASRHTVESLAARVALSPSRFAHLFTEQTGRPPMRALRDARLAHAARLLEVTELPIANVAAASGFVSAFHFSRAFRAAFGVPPREYRNRRSGGLPA